MKDSEKNVQSQTKNRFVQIAAAGVIVVALILILGSIWTGRSASDATEEAVHNVSLFYLDELAGRREQVVEHNLETKIENIETAIKLMSESDLDSLKHLQRYQAKVKQLYQLEKFAFVDTNGTIYMSKGIRHDIDEYPFDYKNLKEPVIAVKDVESENKKVIIAIPIDPIPFLGEKLVINFMEINMDTMLKGVSVESREEDSTFCNIYSREGIPMTGKVLGGAAGEKTLRDALEHMEFDPGYSRDKIITDFAQGQEGVSSFSYNGTEMTLYYVPVKNTDLMLTYLIRESLITDQIQSVTNGIIKRSILQTLLTALVLLAMFLLMIYQTRKSSRLMLEKERTETESRIKQEELEQRLALQEQLLQQEKEQARQDSMIKALGANYRSVYYIDLDQDKSMCFRTDPVLPEAPKEGDVFPYLEKFQFYAEQYIDEAYREEYLKFIEPENLRRILKDENTASLRYIVHREGKDSYEMLRVAGVRDPERDTDHAVHVVGAGFTDVDRETREDMEKSQALSDALKTAEEASKAKTTFLSNMSHEIRTPLNAIIGMDNIALSDESISDQTREYLEKIDGSANHLLTLINDILDMSRIESGRMALRNEEFSFSEMVKKINTMVSGQCVDKGITYDCRMDSEIDERYIGDDMKLRQIILNILGNAVKFTPEGGEITFTVHRTAHVGDKSVLEMVMKDTGIGMEKDFLPKIFETFSQEDSSATNRYGSSGLGMAITRSIVEMMNGEIRVESEKGVGTTFYVTITLRDAEHKKDGAHVEVDPKQMSVLVVDDDPVACEHARLVLEKIGISADIAESGPEAIEMVRLHHARREPYNLILIDWKMPQMDGVEATRQIRAITGDESAIIILTAYRWDDVLEEALSAGVDSFLSKPLFAESVIDEFSSALQKKMALSGETEHKADLNGKRVLLAEDVPVNAEIIVLQLGMKGMEVDVAENGRIAVDKYTSQPAGHYDAILMDMRMPEMDGLTATKLIRSTKREDAERIPIIALTANAFDEDVQRSLQAGLNAHISKPVDPQLLFETLESLIKD